MRRLRVLVLCLASLVAVGTGTWPALLAQSGAPARPALQVLFVGNSFTFFNSLSEVVSGLASSLTSGPQIEPTMFATGGMTLQWFWAAGKAAALIDSRRWDYVVLQEQSTLGGGSEGGEANLSPPGIFHQSVRSFVPRIRQNGATPLLLMTWARRTRPAEQALLSSAYDSIGRELEVDVSPAGIAWRETRRRWPALDLHVADGSHPNPTGTYLTACVLYASLTGRSPRGAAAKIVGHPYSRALQGVDESQTVTLVDLEPGLARRLQDLSWTVVSQARKPVAPNGL